MSESRELSSLVGTINSVPEINGTETIEDNQKTKNIEDLDPDEEVQTYDHWPKLSKKFYPKPIPRSTFRPDYTITWDYDTTEFLKRADVKGQPPKIIMWMVKTRYLPPLPEPVHMRFCPEMPCRMTTNKQYQKQSAALVWAGQIMRDPEPPKRSHPDQVFVMHNHESQDPGWIQLPSFRKISWKSAFNWTMSYRFDSDIVDLYGLVVKRKTVPEKNYTDILAKKKRFAFWLVSHCPSYGRREDYVKLLQQHHISVDSYGDCGSTKCPRSHDDACFQLIDTDYKFFLAFENALCKDYITEKLFRYLGANVVVVARGSNEYRYHAPPGIFVNTADFKTTKELADYLLYLDSHPEEYIKILKKKDQYQYLYEDYPIRSEDGEVVYMHYHYEAVSMCEMCRRLWNLNTYRKSILDIVDPNSDT
ncbi:hypothetical protein C0Q70_20082 [Pomacea canaliculata]|uniref:Fucosyltransferase n=1 Tax=Pomacea canaliculata TaxID=400727 RepID=A0A2T7NEN9_POMCA|nr:hypothetical protein C0Q70_20082 [Pomacea canaliculata]